jgi:hypothetical protein
MATKRMTSKDYRKELRQLELDRLALEKRIRARANEMCKRNPDIIISTSPNKINNVYTGDYIKMNVEVITALSLIEIIEKELASKHPHKQMKIVF